jgi:polygalacturonase
MRLIAYLSCFFAITLAICASQTGNTTCLCTSYSQIAAAVKFCSRITLQNVNLPGNTSLDLSKLHSNSVVTFAGLTTFGYTNSSGFTPISLGGKNVTITAEPNAIIDGNGQMYWDGLGSNGGLPKFVLEFPHRLSR